jgi:hypothetical protein
MKKTVKIFLGCILCLGLFLNCANFNSVESASFETISDKMSVSELSYFGRISGTSTAGNSIFRIQTSGNPSNTTSNLFIGTTLSIANSGGGSDQYFVSGIASTADIEISTPLDADNTFDGAYVIATNSAIHTISFNPTNSVVGGVWQVLLKASDRTGEISNDGIPDQGGFDLGSTTPTGGSSGSGTRLTNSDITCPWNGVASVGTTVVLTSSDISDSYAGSYHLISCTLPLDGTNPVDAGTTGTISIGRSLSYGSQIINPSAALSHIEGRADSNADTYAFVLRHTYSDGIIIDSAVGKIAVFEGVKVSAPVDPTITFYLDAPAEVGVGQTRCNSVIDAGAVYTTATTINYGSLNLSEFNDLAQRFSCTTNAKDGYIIQVYENDYLTNTNTGTTIANTNCDTSTTCNLNTANAWSTDTGSNLSEFGYSLEAIGSGQSMAFNSGLYKPFGLGSVNASTIMSRSSTPNKIDQGYICYRVTASNFQEAGNYENQITFLATATF